MKKCKFPDKIRIPFVISIIAALSITSVALTAPRWDHLFKDNSAGTYVLKMDVSQNLWKIDERSSSIYKSKIIDPIPDQSWKGPLRFLLFAALASGFLSLVLLIVGSMVNKLDNFSIQLSILSLVALLCGAAGGLCFKCALDFNDKHKVILNEEAFKPINRVPVGQFNMDMGYTLSLAGGGMFAFSAAFALVVIVIDLVKRKLKKPTSTKIASES